MIANPSERLRRDRRRYVLVIVLLIVATAAVMPFDAPISAAAVSWDHPADVQHELEALQQFGQLSACLIVVFLIVRLRPERWRRLLDLGLAMGVVVGATRLLKIVIARPRPSFLDPWGFTGLFGTYYPLDGDDPLRPWASDYSLASMPSSHTAAAVVLSIFLATFDPRLRGFAIVMAAIVGISRVVLRAHYPSDVVVGALAGFVLAIPLIQRSAGVRLLDWIWRRFQPSAQPALPDLLEAERRLRAAGSEPGRRAEAPGADGA